MMSWARSSYLRQKCQSYIEPSIWLLAVLAGLAQLPASLLAQAIRLAISSRDMDTKKSLDRLLSR
jgi:hypothetical protein